MSEGPRVAAIVLHWNQLEDTLACLAALARSTYRPHDVIVVDNASDLPCEPIIAGRFPEVEVLTQATNLGYAGGNNVGIRHALRLGCDFCLLLNDDIELEFDCVEKLVAEAEAHPTTGFIGPKILSLEARDVLLTVGGGIRADGSPFLVGMGETDRGQHDRATEVDYVSGSAMLVRRTAIEAVGLLDEDYFAYREDVDWCLRGKALGLGSRVLASARAWHPDTRARDAASPSVTYYITRNDLLFASKHHLGKRYVATRLVGHVRTLISWSVRPKWRARHEQRDALAAALRDHALGRVGRRGGHNGNSDDLRSG